MMKYFKCIKDKNGYVHSIDNVIYIYNLKNFNMNTVAKELIALRDENQLNGWEKLNVTSCSKYCWYQNVVHIEAIHIMFGKYQEYDRLTKRSYVLPMLRLEVNPNKRYEDKSFKLVLNWIHENCTNSEIKKYDYAIDVPCSLSDIKIISSRKEPGLYKKTRYRGFHGKHGFLKIYDKSLECGCEETITRIEYSFHAGKKYNFDRIGVANFEVVDKELPALDNLNQIIVNMCKMLEVLGIPYEEYISKMNYRRRRTIEPYLNSSFCELKYDESIIQSLLEQIDEVFGTDNTIINKQEKIDFQGMDGEDFVHVEEWELPFDL